MSTNMSAYRATAALNPGKKTTYGKTALQHQAESVCYKCQQKGHWARDCTADPDTLPPPNRELYECPRCGVKNPGHTLERCPVDLEPCLGCGRSHPPAKALKCQIMQAAGREVHMQIQREVAEWAARKGIRFSPHGY